MKTNRIITLFCAVSAVVACSKDLQPSSENVADKVVATINNEDVDTKTSLSGVNMTWSTNDAIQVISHDNWLAGCSKYGVYTLDEATAESAVGRFTYTSGTQQTSGSTKYYAVYGGASNASFQGGGSATATNLYLYFNIPLTQTYVENGVADNYLPMYGHGSSLGEMKFDYLASVLRLRLWSSSEVTVSKISVTSNKIVTNSSGFGLYKDCYSTPDNAHIAGNIANVSLSEIVMTPNKALSTDSSNPTEFNIVIPGCSQNQFIVTISGSNGKTMKLVKSTFDAQGGKIYVMPTVEFNATDSHVCLTWDEHSEPISISNIESGNVLKGTVNVTTSDGNSVTDSEMTCIASLVSQASDSSIDLDMSEITLASGNFANFFYDNKSIKNLIFPNGVTTIGKSGIGSIFNSSNNITDIVLQEGVTTILNSAFSGYKHTLHVPASVTSIELGNGFTITGFDVDAGNTTYKSENGVLFSQDGTKLIFYPGGCTNTTYTIPSGVTEVGTYGFQHATNLTTLIVPAAVAVMRAPFTDCTNLNSITLQGENTTLTGITYDDDNKPELFNRVGKNGTITCTGFSNYVTDAVWSKFNSKLGWTFNDGSTSASVTSAISDLNSESPEIDWK